MAGSDGRRRGRFPRWLAAVAIVVPLLAFGVGVTLGSPTSPANSRAYLGTLARFQGGVLAIVFSVTLLGIQLISRLYSPRMMSLFVKAPVFLFTFSVFVVSIGLDVLLLYVTPVDTDPLYIGGLYLAAGLATVAVISLFEFIRTVLERSTPEGVVDAFAEELTTERYRRRVEGASGLHPLHPLYSIVMSAISSGEWNTAEHGLRQFGEILERVVEDLGPDPDTEALFAAPMTEYLPEIALHAAEAGEATLVESATGALRGVGIRALDGGSRAGSELSMQGLTALIRDAEAGVEGNDLRRAAAVDVGAVVTAAAARPAPQSVGSGLRWMTSEVTSVLRRDPDQQVTMPLLERHLDTLVGVHRVLLDGLGESGPDSEVAWDEPRPTVDDNTVSGALVASRTALTRLTVEVVGYRERTGRYPVTVGTIHTRWSEVCVDAASATRGTYAVAFVRAYLEAAYAMAAVDPDVERWWARGLARVRDGHEQVVADAIEGATRPGVGSSRFIVTSARSGAAVSGRIFDRLLRGDRPSDEFAAWLTKFLEDVDRVGR